MVGLKQKLLLTTNLTFTINEIQQTVGKESGHMKKKQH